MWIYDKAWSSFCSQQHDDGWSKMISFFFVNSYLKFSLFHENSHVSVSNPICFYNFSLNLRLLHTHSHTNDFFLVAAAVVVERMKFVGGEKIVTIEIDKWKFHMQMHFKCFYVHFHKDIIIIMDFSEMKHYGTFLSSLLLNLLLSLRLLFCF